VIVAMGCTLTVAGCSSKLGTQAATPAGTGPMVVATPIGHKPSSTSGVDHVVITVRSGADVLLSGKDSQGRAAPIASFAWTQASTDNPQVSLVYRSANTVDFAAPNVATATTLNFTLTAADANNTSGSAHVMVKVEPASDPDQFL